MDTQGAESKIQPLVSVIVPTYNRAHTLQTAIDSVLAQDFSTWELLIIDDGSTDNTKLIVARNYDPRIRYFKKQNAGPQIARNYGIEKALGTWITYLDSDDILYPYCLSTMVTALKENPNVVFAMPNGVRMLDLYENSKLISSVRDTEKLGETFTVHDIFMRHARFACLGFMHLRRLYAEGLRWDEQVGGMEDWEFMMSIGTKYPKQFLYVPALVYEYHQRFGGDGICSNSSYGTWADAFEYIYQKHKDDPEMQGQQWYPAKVDKWRKRQAEFEAGTRPPYSRHYFQ